MNLMDVIRQENGELRRIVDQLRAARTPEAVAGKVRRVRLFVRALYQVQSEFLYPALRAAGEGAEEVLVVEREDRDIERELGRIEEMALAGEVDSEAVQTISERLLSHLASKEERLLTRAERVIEPERAGSLGSAARDELDRMAETFPADYSRA